MSAELVEIARRGVDAFNRRDVDGFAAVCTLDYEWRGALLGAVEADSYRGREGIERYFQEAAETWEQLAAPAEEFQDLGDRVLVLGRMEARGRGSGIAVDAPYTMLVEFRGKLISRSRAYLDRDEALRAAGLAG